MNILQDLTLFQLEIISKLIICIRSFSSNVGNCKSFWVYFEKVSMKRFIPNFKNIYSKNQDNLQTTQLS